MCHYNRVIQHQNYGLAEDPLLECNESFQNSFHFQGDDVLITFLIQPLPGRINSLKCAPQSVRDATVKVEEMEGIPMT